MSPALGIYYSQILRQSVCGQRGPRYIAKLQRMSSDLIHWTLALGPSASLMNKEIMTRSEEIV